MTNVVAMITTPPVDPTQLPIPISEPLHTFKVVPYFRYLVIDAMKDEIDETVTEVRPVLRTRQYGCAHVTLPTWDGPIQGRMAFLATKSRRHMYGCMWGGIPHNQLATKLLHAPDTQVVTYGNSLLGEVFDPKKVQVMGNADLIVGEENWYQHRWTTGLSGNCSGAEINACREEAENMAESLCKGEYEVGYDTIRYMTITCRELTDAATLRMFISDKV